MYVAAVSDGLGSKKYSHIGSKTICEVVLETVSKCVDFSCLETFVKNIHREWNEKLHEEYNISDCAATCLFCVVKDRDVIIGQLGDGFICYIDEANKIVLQDDNETHFANETDCLCKINNMDIWKLRKLTAQTKMSILLSTDGLNVGYNTIDDIISFSEDFQNGYEKFSVNEINRHIFEWLDDWYGGDDKTIAYILRC